jgi:hypothetical protein
MKKGEYFFAQENYGNVRKGDILKTKPFKKPSSQEFLAVVDNMLCTLLPNQTKKETGDFIPYWKIRKVEEVIRSY